MGSPQSPQVTGGGGRPLCPRLSLCTEQGQLLRSSSAGRQVWGLLDPSPSAAQGPAVPHPRWSLSHQAGGGAGDRAVLDCPHWNPLHGTFLAGASLFWVPPRSRAGAQLACGRVCSAPWAPDPPALPGPREAQVPVLCRGVTGLRTGCPGLQQGWPVSPRGLSFTAQPGGSRCVGADGVAGLAARPPLLPSYQALAACPWACEPLSRAES